MAKCDAVGFEYWGGLTMDEKTLIDIENAIQSLAQADRILDEIADSGGSGDSMPPYQAAHVWIFRAMCLMIDSLEGIEETSFSSEENVPVAKTKEPYEYLAARYEARADRFRQLAREHGT